jgi:hypothetical protein
MITDQKRRCCTCKYYIAAPGAVGACYEAANVDVNGTDEACGCYVFAENPLNRRKNER